MTAYCTATEVFVRTPYTSDDIAEAVVTAMITAADSYITSLGLTSANSEDLKTMSIYMTAHFIEKALIGSQVQYTNEGISTTVKQDISVWMEMFKIIASGINSKAFKKVYF